MAVRRLFFVSMLAVLALAGHPEPRVRRLVFDALRRRKLRRSVPISAGDLAFEDEFERRSTREHRSAGWAMALPGSSSTWAGRRISSRDTTSGTFELGDSNVTTFMANLILGVPVGGQTGGGVRPYVVGGVGLLRSNISGQHVFQRSHVERFRHRTRRRTSRLLQRSRWLTRRHSLLPPAAGQRTRHRRPRSRARQLQFLACIDWRDVPLRQLTNLNSSRTAFEPCATGIIIAISAVTLHLAPLASNTQCRKRHSAPRVLDERPPLS